MSKSLLQLDSRECFLCGRNGQADRLERHHIFGAANRNKSEDDGLWVWLCGDRCHRNGKQAAHRNKMTMNALRRVAEGVWLKETGKTEQEFIERYGKDYLHE